MRGHCGGRRGHKHQGLLGQGYGDYVLGRREGWWWWWWILNEREVGIDGGHMRWLNTVRVERYSWGVRSVTLHQIPTELHEWFKEVRRRITEDDVGRVRDYC